MQFDWTTFFLEILNFLVLLWILQRLIYRPLLAVLDVRQQKIQAQIDAVAQLRGEAEALKTQLETRLVHWEQERQQQRNQLETELSQLRSQALAEIKQTQTDEAAKLQARNEALLATQQSLLLREANHSAYANVALMLQRLSSSELTHAIVTTLLEDLHNLAEAEHAALVKAAENLIAASAVEIITAHPLSDSDHSAVLAGLNLATGKTLSPVIREDSNLLAGLRIVIGECQLHANLADELAFFKQQQYD